MFAALQSLPVPDRSISSPSSLDMSKSSLKKPCYKSSKSSLAKPSTKYPSSWMVLAQPPSSTAKVSLQHLSSSSGCSTLLHKSAWGFLDISSVLPCGSHLLLSPPIHRLHLGSMLPRIQHGLHPSSSAGLPHRSVFTLVHRHSGSTSNFRVNCSPLTLQAPPSIQFHYGPHSHHLHPGLPSPCTSTSVRPGSSAPPWPLAALPQSVVSLVPPGFFTKAPTCLLPPSAWPSSCHGSRSSSCSSCLWSGSTCLCPGSPQLHLLPSHHLLSVMLCLRLVLHQTPWPPSFLSLYYVLQREDVLWGGGVMS